MAYDRTFFYENTWTRFRPRRNLKLLLTDSKDLFYRQKQISFCAVSAWLVRGGATGVIQHAICIGITSALVAAERKAAAVAQTSAKSSQTLSTLQLAAASPFLDSMAANMAVPVITGAEFFECAYWPIGGLATLARSHSTAEHGRELSRKKTLSNSLEMMRSLHVAHERLLESDRSELSLGKAAYVVQSVLKRGQGVAADQLERHWQFYKNRIALLYAANSLKIDDDRTLLEEMERYYPRLELCEEHLLTWLGMASFALAVLDRCPVNWDDFSNPVSLSSLNGRRIPSGVTPVPFSPEHDYSTSQVEQIIETFQKKKRGRPRKRNS